MKPGRFPLSLLELLKLISKIAEHYVWIDIERTIMIVNIGKVFNYYFRSKKPKTRQTKHEFIKFLLRNQSRILQPRKLTWTLAAQYESARSFPGSRRCLIANLRNRNLHRRDPIEKRSPSDAIL